MEFKKVNGNYKPRIIPPLERGRNTITLSGEIADIFADYYANISKDPHKKSKPEKCRKRRRKKTYHITNHSQTENREDEEIPKNSC